MADEAQAARPRRLFAPELPAQGGELELPRESAHHARVLRLCEGDRVQLFDGRLGQADAVLLELARDRALCRAAPRALLAAPSPALHVVLGLPKGGKLEDIARMLTELGVGALHMALCERSVSRPIDASARLSRLARVVLEACAQSGQPLAPALHAPRPLLQIAEGIPAQAAKVVFWERGDGPLEAAIDPGEQAAPAVFAVIGPEGGLSEAEIAGLRALGFRVVGLGGAILRVETAAPVAAALLLDRLGRFAR